MDRLFTTMLARAVADGLDGAALVDRNGNAVAIAGVIAEEEAMPLAAVVMYRLKSADLAPRLFAGEILSMSLDDRDVAVCVAKRQLFVVAVLAASTPATLARVRQVRDDVERMLADATGDVTPTPWNGAGGGGSGSGPAELPLFELDLSLHRERGKA